MDINGFLMAAITSKRPLKKAMGLIFRDQI
jgi:hypothetical protein